MLDTAPARSTRVDDLLGDPSVLADALWSEVDVRAEATGTPMGALIAAARASDGGKYLRPRLVAASYSAFGGADAILLRRVAGAQQLIHVALCVHDDLIDGDRVRHGRANVVGHAEAEAHDAGLESSAAARQGLAAGVLAGDLALNAAVLALVTAPAPEATRLRLAETALQAVERAIGGELLDVRSEALEPADCDPITVARLKTASYSVTLPLALGAIAAGSGDDATLASIDLVGTALGVAYQLEDDDLGLFGSPEVTGKSTLSDLRDGKRTELVRLAIRDADPAGRALVEQSLGRPDADDHDLEAVRRIVVATGARDAVRRLADHQLELGVRTARAELPAALADHLAHLADTLRDRAR